nr:hypothetical protein [Escherichia coli]
MPLRTTPSVAEQEGQLIETEATGEQCQIRRSLAASEGEEQRFPGQLVDYRDKTQRGGRSGRHPTIRITGAPGSPGVA